MLDSTSTARVVFTSASSAEEAQRIARTLVEERIAACATILPAAQSIYRWQGKIETAQEMLIIVKTSHEHLVALEARLQTLHSYETPEILVLAVESGSRAYLKWLQASLQEP